MTNPSRNDKELLLSLLAVKREREKYNRFNYYFPEDDNFDFNTEVEPSGKIYSRKFYSKHMEFFDAGGQYPDRLFMAGNRVGKSFTGAYEMVCHLTGLYPEWWTGKRFNRPVKAWACTKTKAKTQETLANLLIGSKADPGCGLIPRDLIDAVISMPGTPEGVSKIRVKNITGGVSEVVLKSYEEGQSGFVGTAMDVIWLDEECPPSIYTECQVRTATTRGITYITFTPDDGLSETVLLFFKNGQVKEGANGYKYLVMCSWDDVPHLDAETKRRLFNDMPPNLREAKMRGIPYIGSGAVYPIIWEDVVIAPHKLDDKLPRAFGLDVGYRVTAQVLGAYDKENDRWEIYDEFVGINASPAQNAPKMKIKTKGWIEGVIDRASKQHSQTDSNTVYDLYQQHGINVYAPTERLGLESTIQQVYEMLYSGKIKIWSNCTGLLSELRVLRRDDKGRVVGDDHFADAFRYLLVCGDMVLRTDPNYDDEESVKRYSSFEGRSAIGGY